MDKKKIEFKKLFSDCWLAFAKPLGRLMTGLFAVLAVNAAGRWVSNMQITFRFGRMAAFGLLVGLLIALADIAHRLSPLMVFTEVVLFLGFYLFLFGARFPNRKSRVVGYVAFQRIELHLMRVEGMTEKRRLKDDLAKVVKDGAGVGATVFVLSSPQLCRVRASARITSAIDQALGEHEPGTVWVKNETGPFWMSVVPSLIFWINYGDTLSEEEKRHRRLHRLFNRIPTGLKLIQSNTIRYTMRASV